MIVSGFELCTDVPVDEIVDIGNKMTAGENPVEFKHRLAYEIVAAFLNDEAADKASEHFTQVHKSGEVPSDAPEFAVGEGMSIIDVLVGAGIVKSRGEAKRQVEQAGVKVDGNVIEDPMLVVHAGSVIQKGKRYFVVCTH